jgi:hypothetical protein
MYSGVVSPKTSIQHQQRNIKFFYRTFSLSKYPSAIVLILLICNIAQVHNSRLRENAENATQPGEIFFQPLYMLCN